MNYKRQGSNFIYIFLTVPGVQFSFHYLLRILRQSLFESDDVSRKHTKCFLLIHAARQ